MTDCNSSLGKYFICKGPEGTVKSTTTTSTTIATTTVTEEETTTTTESTTNPTTMTTTQSPKCPDGWVIFKDSCYLVNSNSSNFANATSFCQGLESRVLEILSVEEDEFIDKYLDQFDSIYGSVWLNMAIQDDKAAEWLDGTEVNYTNFRDQDDFDDLFTKGMHCVERPTGNGLNFLFF